VRPVRSLSFFSFEAYFVDLKSSPPST
jgi:hypothetical protein